MSPAQAIVEALRLAAKVLEEVRFKAEIRQEEVLDDPADPKLVLSKIGVAVADLDLRACQRYPSLRVAGDREPWRLAEGWHQLRAVQRLPMLRGGDAPGHRDPPPEAAVSRLHCEPGLAFAPRSRLGLRLLHLRVAPCRWCSSTASLVILEFVDRDQVDDHRVDVVLGDASPPRRHVERRRPLGVELARRVAVQDGLADGGVLGQDHR